MLFPTKTIQVSVLLLTFVLISNGFSVTTECVCMHGNCTWVAGSDQKRHCKPGSCTAGWSGIDCANCTDCKSCNCCTCVHGICDRGGTGHCTPGSCQPLWTGKDCNDSMGGRQNLNLRSYLQKSLEGPAPPNCTLADVDFMLYKVLAGDEQQQQEVLQKLENINDWCPNWLFAVLDNYTKNADLNVPACHALRLYQKTRDVLPNKTLHSFGLALVNMVNTPTWGSYYPFLERFMNDPLELDNSENHDMNKKSQQSLAIEVLASLPGPEFGPDLKLADGYTVSQHLEGWRSYWRSYFRLIALHGINIETGSQVYSKCFLEGLTCLHDLTMDGGLQNLISDYLQVYYADAATEFLVHSDCSGARGGAKARIKADYRLFDDSPSDHGYGISHIGWLLGWFSNLRNESTCNDYFFNDTTSSVITFVHEAATCFRPLPQIQSIASPLRNLQHPFMSTSFRRGRASDFSASFFPVHPQCARNGSEHSGMVNGTCYFFNHTYPGDEPSNTRLQYGILRHTYIAPEYVLGTVDFAEDCDFNAIAQQNLWMGALFASSYSDKLGLGGVGEVKSWSSSYPVGTGIFSEPSGVTVPGSSAVKRTVKSQAYSLYFSLSRNLFQTLNVTSDGWHCFQDSTAISFGCVRPVGNEGSEELKQISFRGGMIFVLSKDPWAPIVVQLSPSSSYSNNFSKFIEAVQGTDLHWDNSTGARYLKFTSLLGSTIEMYGRSINPSTINGTKTQAQCKSGPRHDSNIPNYNSPFMTGGGSWGRVSISSSLQGTSVLDFTATNPRHQVGQMPSEVCSDANPGWYISGATP
eukprot:m.94247 g.94247  ORF g.94247 m.94247 type:complete len:806 (-) comp13435_c0_seq1:231-2648(-)